MSQDLTLGALEIYQAALSSLFLLNVLFTHRKDKEQSVVKKTKVHFPPVEMKKIGNNLL